MDLAKYSIYVSLENKKEIDKCIFLGYYFSNTKEQVEFTIDDLLEYFDVLHFSKPNVYRLKKNIQASRAFVNGKSKSTYKLHAKFISQLDSELIDFKVKSEEIITDDTIIPESLYKGTRGYIESLAMQINAAFEYNIFDGCAVLMRRLLEILLIHSYENLSIDSDIKDSNGNYKMLNLIVVNAKSNTTLSLSRNTKETIEIFRTIGNFSAHKIFYNAKRKDISSISKEYRAVIEELLYKSGILS